MQGVTTMRSIALHAGASQVGPLALDAAAVLFVGFVVVAAILYDAYRQYGA
jgi:hypothetical protein